MPQLIAEIISVGDEMTSGQRIDTNSSWLSRELTSSGIQVGWHSTVGDDFTRQLGSFRVALGRADVVIVTGGLGPTADDLTRLVIAETSQKPLVRNDSVVRHIEAIFRRYGREMPAGNAVQADFPEGSRIIENVEGTAPGIDISIPRNDTTGGDCRFFCLPSVPAEMKSMWQSYVGPILQQMNGGGVIIRQRVLNCFGAGESQVEAMLPDMIARNRHPRIGITASNATISLRMTAIGSTHEECTAALDADEAVIRERLGTLLFGVEDELLEQILIRQLSLIGKTLFVVDSGLQGQLFQLLGGVDTSGSHFIGGHLNPWRGPQPEDVECASSHLSDVAVQWRKQSGSDIGVAIGPVWRDPSNQLEFFAMTANTPNSSDTWILQHAGHPSFRLVRSCKQVMNTLRLWLPNLTTQ